MTQHHQAIIPSYRFNCNGNITEWGVGVYSSTSSYTLDLQVWRPSPTTDDSTGTGCYSLVGNNRFVSITPSRGVVVATPSPQDYIQFQPGDVIGFYIEEASLLSNGAINLIKSGTYANQLVWLTSVAPEIATTLVTNCPLPALPWTSLRAAPVLSIAVTGILAIYRKDA